MRTIFLVQQEEADKARAIETKLLKLPENSGILFAGVSILPGEAPVYRIWVGCERGYDEGLVRSLVQYSLREELESGLQTTVEVHRGVVRNAVDAA